MNAAQSLHFFLLFSCLQLAAQEHVGAFSTERLSSKDGMSHSRANCVHQDTQGIFWIGTYDGLNRYDGYEFQVFRPSQSGFSFEADEVWQIAEAQSGVFYLNTGHRLFRFDPVTAAFELSLPIADESVVVWNPGAGSPVLEPGSYQNWLHKDASLSVYQLLPSGKLSFLVKLERRPSDRPLYLIFCTGQSLWFWDTNGTYWRYDLGQKKWSSHPVAAGAKAPVDASGKLWLPQGEKLGSFQLPVQSLPAAWSWFQYKPGKEVWLFAKNGQNTSSLLRFDLQQARLETILPNLNEFVNIAPIDFHKSFSPLSLQLDREATLWFADYNGLIKVRRTRNMFRHYLAQPLEKGAPTKIGLMAMHMVEDADGKIFLRDNHNRLFKLDPNSGASEQITLPVLAGQHDETYLVFGISTDAEGYIWMKTDLGFLKYEPRGGQFQFFQNQHSIEKSLVHDDGRGKLWYTVEGTLYLLDKKTGTTQRAPDRPYGNLIYSAMMPKENTLWSFTDSGLVQISTINFGSRHIRLYDEPREQRAIVSHRGWLWVGTSRGLEKVDPKTFAHTNFDRSKGLPANFIYSILADGDYLWLGTGEGLCRFQVATGVVKNFYVEDGLSHNEFNSNSALKTADGRIYMGGLNGVNAFFPADLERKMTLKPRLLLSRFSRFDANKDSLIFLNAARLAGGVELSPSVTSFNLHLALTSFIDPAKNQYAWRMDGLDEDWFYAGSQHIATYRRIPPGSYTFRAKAADSFGNWSENELALRITVLGPWYSRWWAWLMYVLVAGAALYFLRKHQIRVLLERAEKLRLQELDRFKSRFFTNITHEFRTPLTVILGNLEMEKLEIEKFGKPADGKISRFFNFLISKNAMIRRNAENLLRLINQILDLAKLENDSLKINYVQGDVLPYLRYVAESLQSLANAQNVMLRVDSDQAKIEMDYDPERLLQIVHNLLSNAIKFTPSGGQVVLHVNHGDFENHHDLGNHLLLSVSDTGAGIPPEDLPNIFDRFYQANNLEKAKTGGTGVGLSLTKELVKAMDGKISVESEVGKGSIFTVRLPITNKAAVSDRATLAVEKLEGNFRLLPKFSHESKHPGAQASPEGTGNHLLIIEDNPDVMEYLAACLGENYFLDFAYNGRSGIERALEIVPDLIVSDVMMPEKDGFEVCEFLKNDERTSHIPIVLLTAKADMESRIAGLRRGADAYLSKPFQQEELLVTLQNLLELRKKLQAHYAVSGIFSFAQSESAATPGPVADPGIQIEDAFLKRLNDAIEKHLSDADLEVPQLCRALHMSQSQLYRKIKALTDKSIASYVRTVRLHKGRELLKNSSLNVSEVAYEVGFTDPAYFSRTFSEEFGFAPNELRK